MDYREGQRFLYLDTPLGEDKLLLKSFSGHEAMSQLFEFHVHCMAENATSVDFEKLIGQKVGFGVLGAEARLEPRHFHGIVNRVAQGSRDRTFTEYYLTVVPEIWKLTRKFQSRIFQHITIPDVLKKVLAGYDVAYEIQGPSEPKEQREYLTQYRETDFDFFSRIMEEEGIFYFFKFARGSHKLVLANTSSSNVDIPGSSRVIYEEVAGGGREEERISGWQKEQNFGSGKRTLWDHHFELPHKHLDADQTVIETVPVGKVQHKLKVAGNESLEVYDYPGVYAQRFDGIDKGGGEKSGDLQKIFQDNKRTVGIRMQQTELPMLRIHGNSNCRYLTTGHKFTLQRHFNADGPYVLTQVEHEAEEGAFRTGAEGEKAELHYENRFTCIPLALLFRPPQVTGRPTVAGPQTGVVVGPPGEEIFTDKYGRIKVQFHWDRDGKNDADSSCWLRVGTLWAGQNWGVIHIPRIGQEVVVSFLEGDPDRPIVLGSVYNADQMPVYELPKHKTVSTTKSRSTMHGGKTNFNELRFEDLKDKEQVFLHAERDKDERVKKESREYVGQNRHTIIKQNHKESIDQSRHTDIKQDHIVHVGGSQKEAIDGSLEVKIAGSHQQLVSQKFAYGAGTEIHLQSGAKVVIEAGAQLTLKGPGGFVDISPIGVVIQGTMVLINSGGAAGAGSGSNPSVPSPDQPDTADDGTKFDKL